MSNHVGECCHDLLFGRQISTFFEFEIANCAGQSEVAIDSSKVDKATSSADSCFFACLHQLLALTKEGRLTDLHSAACGQTTAVLHVPLPRVLIANHRHYPNLDQQSIMYRVNAQTYHPYLAFREDAN